MYLSTDHLHSLLRQTGASGYDLHVSSAVGLTKHRGTLYDHVVRVARRPPEDILHIGDNPHSDYVQPRKRGIVAHHWVKTPRQIPSSISLRRSQGRGTATSPRVGCWPRPSPAPAQAPAFGVRDALGDDRVRGHRPAVFGLHVLGVGTRASPPLSDGLLPFADGFHPLRVFNMIRERQGHSVHARYLLASRRLWNVAAITELDGDTMEFLITPNPAMRVRHFMERLGTRPRAISV